MTPPAPWTILNIDLADGLPDLMTIETPGLLVIFRYRNAVVGKVHLLPENFPLRAADLALVAAQSTQGAIAELLRLGAQDKKAETPFSPVAPAGLSQILGPDVLDRLAEHLAERRSRPIGVSASIVICTRHRSHDLARCLEAIQSEIASGREVVVVDNGPDAATEAAVRAHPRLRYVIEPRPGLSCARNAGIAAASGDVVIFVDDDVRPEPGWIEPLLRRFAEPGVGVVCGLVLPETLETEAQIAFEYQLGFGGMGVLPLRFDAGFVEGWRRGVKVWRIGAGANMAIRRRTALALGGFDERVGPGAAGGCGDDSEFWHRVLFAGQSAIYEPLSVVRHQHRRDWPALDRQAYGYSFGHVVALFAQFARDGDRGDLIRAFVDFPIWLVSRLLNAPRRRLAGKPDVLLGAWIRGYLAALRHAPMAFRKGPSSDGASPKGASVREERTP